MDNFYEKNEKDLLIGLIYYLRINEETEQQSLDNCLKLINESELLDEKMNKMPFDSMGKLKYTVYKILPEKERTIVLNGLKGLLEKYIEENGAEFENINNYEDIEKLCSKIFEKK